MQTNPKALDSFQTRGPEFFLWGDPIFNGSNKDSTPAHPMLRLSHVPRPQRGESLGGALDLAVHSAGELVQLHLEDLEPQPWVCYLGVGAQLLVLSKRNQKDNHIYLIYLFWGRGGFCRGEVP